MHHPLASGIRPRALADDPPLADAWPRRWYALLVSGFTAWVGCMGLFRPTDILRALPWPVPPLHARTVGALYLAATVFLCLAAASRRASVWPVPPPQQLQAGGLLRVVLLAQGWLLTLLATALGVWPDAANR
jgi:hypothetical protein